MPIFSLLTLQGGGNTAISTVTANTKAEAVEELRQEFPQLQLDTDGYAKAGPISYCTAEQFGS